MATVALMTGLVVFPAMTTKGVVMIAVVVLEFWTTTTVSADIVVVNVAVAILLRVTVGGINTVF